MKNLQKLLQELSALTLEIEEKYPELYRDFDEMPLTLGMPNKEGRPVDTHDLQEYLETLKAMLEKEVAARQ